MLGSQLFGVVRPAIIADLLVIVATTIAAIAPRRYRIACCVAAATASIVVSIVVAADSAVADVPVMGDGAWPGIAEFAGIGFLAGWCIRTGGTTGATVGAASLGGALFFLLVARQHGDYTLILAMLASMTWTIIALAGLYLRWLDLRRDESAMLARQQERITIAQELHDMVAHHVTGIVVQAQAGRLVAGGRPEFAGQALERIEEAGGEALGAMRRMVGSLRDDTASVQATPMATLADLDQLAATAVRGEVPISLEYDHRVEHLPPEVISSVYRIAREAVTNARRHAVDATIIEIDVRCRDDVVLVQVRNDGAPPERTPGSGGYGLTGMAERAASLGGRFHAGPMPAGGWRVAAELPAK